jgi:hypothetical protein
LPSPGLKKMRETLLFCSWNICNLFLILIAGLENVPHAPRVTKRAIIVGLSGDRTRSAWAARLRLAHFAIHTTSEEGKVMDEHKNAQQFS